MLKLLDLFIDFLLLIGEGDRKIRPTQRVSLEKYRSRLYTEQGRKCKYCGASKRKANFQIDHVDPCIVAVSACPGRYERASASERLGLRAYTRRVRRKLESAWPSCSRTVSRVLAPARQVGRGRPAVQPSDEFTHLETQRQELQSGLRYEALHPDAVAVADVELRTCQEEAEVFGDLPVRESDRIRDVLVSDRRPQHGHRPRRQVRHCRWPHTGPLSPSRTPICSGSSSSVRCSRIFSCDVHADAGQSVVALCNRRCRHFTYEKTGPGQELGLPLPPLGKGLRRSPSGRGGRASMAFGGCWGAPHLNLLPGGEEVRPPGPTLRRPRRAPLREGMDSRVRGNDGCGRVLQRSRWGEEGRVCPSPRS